MVHSFTQTARRKQLVASAITVIADVGLERASTVVIAQHAEVSRGVLTHHFADRDDLIEAVVAEVYRVGKTELGPVVAAQPTPKDALLTFVSGSIDLYAAFPDHMLALSEIFYARRRAEAGGRATDPRHRTEMDDVATLLQAGQASGQFRADFDVVTMAGVVRSTLDAGLQRVRAGADRVALGAELVQIIDLATRS